jgi:hypothetical protein
VIGSCNRQYEIMDPIAICGSALNVLNKIKEQLKECEAAFENAAELNAMLEIFEVTIMMVRFLSVVCCIIYSA